MCDYSLHAFPNRLAVDGEELVVHRFGGGSLGLASVADVCSMSQTASARSAGFWSWETLKSLKSWFEPIHRPTWRIPAVCIPPGATLVLRDIPRGMQRELGVGEEEQVTFIETTANVNTYRDAVRFENQAQVLLQALREGQRVRVVSLDLAEADANPVQTKEEVPF